MNGSNRLISIVSVVLLIGGFDTVSHTQVPTSARPGDPILLFPVSRQEFGDRERLLARVKDHLSSDPSYRARQGLDLVIIFTDESGRAILPDSAAEAAAPESTGPTARKN
jgi:hypothetical protein